MSDFQKECKKNKQNENQKLKVELYYYREDNNYDGWNVWMWGEDIGERQVDFSESSGENSYGRVAVLTIDDYNKLEKIGFIVRKSDENDEFSERESYKDRFLYAKDADENGKIKVYVIQGKEELQPKRKKIKVRMHYRRKRGDYKEWDIHAWMSNGYKADIAFNDKEDSYGKVAQFEVESEIADKLGFLIRRGGNNWEEKEANGKERYVNLRQYEDNGVVDIYVSEKKEEIFFERPIVVNFYYKRYDDDYKNWDIWVWEKYISKKDASGCAVDFYDDYKWYHNGNKIGKIATYVCGGIEDVKKIGFLVRKSEGEEWKDVDLELDRYITRDKILEAQRTGELNVYIAQNDLGIGFNKSDIDLSPKIVDATFLYPDSDGFKIDIELNDWVDIDGGNIDELKNKFRLMCEDGTVIPIRRVFWLKKNAHNKSRLFRIYLDNKVEANNTINPIDKRYNLSFEGFTSLPVSIKNLYEHQEFKKKYIYKFGVKYNASRTEFRVLAPFASELELCIYDSAVGGEPIEVINLEDANNGMWYLELNKDLKGKFYTYRAKVGDKIYESIDSYAKVLQENCERGVIVDPKENVESLGFKPKFSEYIFPIADELGVNRKTIKGENGEEKVITEFRIWAPAVDDLELCLYNEDIGGEPIESYRLNRSYGGTWCLRIDRDLKGKFYTYKSRLGTKVIESVDPCAKAAGVNCERGAIIDLKDTNPEGWENTPRPTFDNSVFPIISEINVRDYTINKNSGVDEKYRGKFKGLTIKGTKTEKGTSTCLDHIIEMGYTHVQIMPVADFGSVDESRSDAVGNWGYDNTHWFVLEGSYSTNPHDPVARIKEFKEMIQTFHENGVGVILDVVFNHTYRTQFSPFNVFAPDYFYRIKENGEYSKATGCSNEIASEKEMVRKYIVDAIKYWVKEFKVDGFRFDVMYLLDIDTMNEIRRAVNEVDERTNSVELRDNSSKIWLYGEGWGADTPPIVPLGSLASRDNAVDVPGIGYLDNRFANGVKGDFDKPDRGFALQGLGSKWKNKIMNCIMADNCEPDQLVNFVGSHDNRTLWDKIKISVMDLNRKTFKTFAKNMFKLAYSMMFARSGLSLVPEGDEFLRTKKCCANSYNAGDEINGINWERKEEYSEVVEYIKGLIRMKKGYKGFNIKSNREIREKINFFDRLPEGMQDHIIAYSIKDRDGNMVVINNGGWQKAEISIPKELGEDWFVILDDEKAGCEKIKKVKYNGVDVLAHSSKVLIDKKSLKEFRERKNANILKILTRRKNLQKFKDKELKSVSDKENQVNKVKVNNKIDVIPRENIERNVVGMTI